MKQMNVLSRIKKFQTTFFAILGLLLLLSIDAKASHMSGGNIDYKCVGRDSFEVTVRVFRYCTGATFGATNVPLTATSTCGAQRTVNLQKVNGPISYLNKNSWDITDVCNSQSTRCTGTTGINGVEMYVFRGIIVLNPRCNHWRLGYRPPCCRPAVRNTGGTPPFLQTRLNTTDFPCNNSPNFDYQFFRPIPQACIGSKITYALSAFDPDSDSLRYSIHSGFVNNFTTATTYNNGFSAAQPITGISIDAQTGLVEFNTTGLTQGNYAVTVAIDEYERCTGKWKGVLYRDLLFQLSTCSPVNDPPIDTMGITGVSVLDIEDTGKIELVSKNYLEVCNGVVFSWSDTVWDPNSGDSIIFDAASIRKEIGLGLSISQTYIGGGDSLAVRFTWRAKQGQNPFKVFALKFIDDYCPGPGTVFSTYTIYVRNSTDGGPDVNFCVGQDTATLTASGGRTYKWKTILGDTIKPGVNFWGDTTATDTNMSIKFFPDKTTYLEVESDLKFGCVSSVACDFKDTVKVTAAKPYNIISRDTSICFSDSTTQLSVRSDSAFFFTYEWSPAASMDNPDSATSAVTPIYTTDYILKMTSDSGCVKYDTTNVFVTPPFPGDITAVTTSSPACPGVAADVTADLGNNPTSCGASTTKCPGVLTATSSSSVANSNQSGGQGPNHWPAPYGGSQRSARQQFLIRASELSAWGITSGMIEGLGFNVVNLNSANTFKNFTIKMGCTSDSVIARWKTGLTTVFNSATVSPAAGWNVHQFNTNFNYDGSSNVVVEVCFDNGVGGATNGGNASTAYVSTGWNSCLVNYGNTAMCSSSNLGWASQTNRPTMRLLYCGAPDSAAYTYEWFPKAGIQNDTLQKTFATVFNTSTYTVVVTDTHGLCFDSAEVEIDIAHIDAGPDTTVCPLDTFSVLSTSNASCNQGTSFKWTSNNPNAYISDTSLSQPNIAVDTTTKFWVQLSDSCGCSLIDSMIVNVNPIEELTFTEVLPNCGIGDGEYFLSVTGGFSPYTYSIDSGVTFSLNHHFTGLGKGYYDLFAKDSLGCPSEIIIDTLKPSATPIIDSTIAFDASCFGFDDGAIDVYASNGIPPYFYTADSGSYWSPNQLLDSLYAGTYDVYAMAIGTLGDTCVSFPMEVTIGEPIELVMDFSMADDTCNSLGNGWAKSVASGGVGPYEYQWSNLTTVNDTVNDSLFAGTYSLIVEDSNSCTIDTTFDINQPTSLLVDSTVVIPVSCNGYDNGQLIIYAKGGTAPYLFSANGGATYFGADTLNGVAKNFATIDSLAPGVYPIKIKDAYTCAIDSPKTVTEPLPMVLTALKDTAKICVTNCANLPISVTGGNGGYTYRWSPDVGNTTNPTVCPEKTTNYVMYATDRKNCASNPGEMFVVLYDSLRTVTLPDTAICFGDRAQLDVKVTGGDGLGYNYEWSPLLPLSNPFAKNPMARIDTNTLFKLKVSDNCGTPPVYDSMLVRVHPKPFVDFLSDTLFGCDPMKFEIENLSTGVKNCTWVVNGDTTVTCGPLSKEFFEPGRKTVGLFVESEFGCESSKTIENYLTVYKTPEAGFSMDPNVLDILNTKVQFTDESKGDISEYLWNFSGLASSEEQNPGFTFPDEPGRYPVNLTVTTKENCMNEIVRSITIGDRYFMYIPSSFTPNGDGKNDIWKPKGSGVEGGEYYLRVFDRWGTVLFETRDVNAAWDGTAASTGEKVANGVYTYRLITGDEENNRERHEEFGNITLIR